MKTPLRLLIITAIYITWSDFSNATGFTKEEQALINKGMTMEMYKPDEHTRHFIAHITKTDPRTEATPQPAKNSPGVVCFVFGMEDAQPAREEGRSMAECKYTPQQAHEFLFAEGWGKYHDRFFTRCYLQEGEHAYEEAVKAQQKPAGPSSTS